jgi:hypothetical protein
MAGSFSAAVSGWTRKSEARLEAVYKESVQRVVSLAQQPVGAGGNMPVDTGFLRASLVTSLGLDLPMIRETPTERGAYSWSEGEIALTIAGATIDTPITAAWTAEYARVAEYGGENRGGRRFVALAAQQWPRIVAEVAAEAEARAGG